MDGKKNRKSLKFVEFVLSEQVDTALWRNFGGPASEFLFIFSKAIIGGGPSLGGN